MGYECGVLGYEWLMLMEHFRIPFILPIDEDLRWGCAEAIEYVREIPMEY